MAFTSFNPPVRTLMGPGPSDVHPRVTGAMARPCIGHLDPAFVGMMDEVKQMLQYAFQTENQLTIPVSAPGSAGMEATFQNLLENAWKYTSKNEKRAIDVSACEERNSITIALKDNGVGFDMKYVDKLFVAFNRLHTPAQFSGTGLGLATVDRVVRRHFGRVFAESSIDSGACFYVEFPRPERSRESGLQQQAAS